MAVATRAIQFLRSNVALRMCLGLIFCVISSLSTGCAGDATGGGSSASIGNDANSKYRILASTLMIADAAGRIAGDAADVDQLMGAGVDPHLYQPTARDRIKLQGADVVLYHGLHLEGNLVETFTALAEQGRRSVSVSRDIPEEKLIAWEEGTHDPHVWHDVQLWKHCVETIARTLIEHDSASADEYRRRADEYLAELDQLHEYCLKRTAKISEEQRWLITSHDAFNYYGRAYGLQVVGIQGISTESEAGLKAITDAVDLIKKHQLRAIFPETSVPPAAIQRVSEDSGAALGPELYSDALGSLDSTAGTYIGMIKENTNAIVDGLTGK